MSSETPKPMESVISKEGSNEYEVDYQENPTELFQALEAKEWAYATTEVEGEPSQASIWVVRKSDEAPGEINWRMLAIHAVVVFHGPATLIESIINAYPEGVRTVDDMGMLPLHLAFRYDASGDVVALLLDAYPDSISVKDKKNRTPIELATVQDVPRKEPEPTDPTNQKVSLSSRLNSFVTCASPKSINMDDLTAQADLKLRTFERADSIEVSSSSAARRAAAMISYADALSSVKSADVRTILEKENGNKTKEMKKLHNADISKMQNLMDTMAGEINKLKAKNSSLEKELEQVKTAQRSAAEAAPVKKETPKKGRFGKKK